MIRVGSAGPGLGLASLHATFLKRFFEDKIASLMSFDIKQNIHDIQYQSSIWVVVYLKRPKLTTKLASLTHSHFTSFLLNVFKRMKLTAFCGDIM